MDRKSPFPEKGEPLRFCRKCLLRDLPEADFFQDLKRYIDNLDEDLKVPEAVYEERLNACRACDRLTEGMCRICGCYVELRAVMKRNICPQVRPRWEAFEAESE